MQGEAMSKKLKTTFILGGILFSASIAKAEFLSNTCQGRYSFSFLGGIAPNSYASRSNANASNAVPPAFELIKIPPFQDQFKVPFILQGELGYMIRNDWEAFYGFDWSHGAGKSHSFSHTDVNGIVDVTGQQKFGDFNGYGNYLGTRFYLTFCCFPIKPFAGFKIGVMTRSEVKAKEVSMSGGTTFTDHITYFKTNTTISGGVHCGFDWQLNQNLSLLFKAEIIGTGERNSRIIFNHPPQPVLKAGDASVQFSFPVTLGIKWTF
jgi:hypothetical protein